MVCSTSLLCTAVSFTTGFLHSLTMQRVRTFGFVSCILLEFIRDKDLKWVSSGWLSKQLSKFECENQKAVNIGFPIPVAGEYMELAQAINCIQLDKQSKQHLGHFRELF